MPSPELLPAAMGLALAAAAQGQVRLASERIGLAADFPAATFLTQPPGESRRLYITLKNGTVKVVRDGAVLSTPMLTSLPGISTGGESGLLGLTFHPQFQANGYVYVLYTTTTAPVGTRIARYVLNPQNPEVADPQSAFTIMTINRTPFINHQGGWIGFGPDGYLYISSGDGGNSNNPQPLTTHLGKILRIDVDHDDFPADPQKNYAIPPTNPFAGSATSLPEIWAAGLRNPWRCSFDRLTGDLWIGDVGQSSIEEINFQPAASQPPFAARNYGWPCMEGSTCFSVSSGCACNSPALTNPVFEYNHSYGVSVMCGYVYLGGRIPALRGTFLLGDVTGAKWSFRFGPPSQIEFTSRTGELGMADVYSFGEDQAGELYFTTPTSGIFRILPHCEPNCDGSTVAPLLNVADFTCFLQRFAAGDPYANCDGSTIAPTLNVTDFTCFLQSYAEGCP
jgi:glucose/arabinose dehydrogenase